MTDRATIEAAGESFAEEIANTVTHGIGVLLSVAGLVVMILMAMVSAAPWSVVAVTVFGSMLVLLYLISASYHGAAQGKTKQLLKILDHITIFLLIAGTYTPIALLGLTSGPDWVLLATIWSLALLGILLKVSWPRRFKALRITLYVAMGWLAVAWAGPMVDSLGWDGTALLLAGGIAYTGGIAFYLWENLPFNHAIWHLFVLTGSAAHFLVVVYFVI